MASRLLLLQTLVVLVAIDDIFCLGQSISCNGDCECPTSVSGVECILTCQGKDRCKDKKLQCRAGDPCSIICDGENSCEGNAVIDGTDATDVDITCSGSNACKGNTVINC